MITRVFVLIILALCISFMLMAQGKAVSSGSYNSPSFKDNNITIEFKLADNRNNYSLRVECKPLETVGKSEWKKNEQHLYNGYGKLNLVSTGPLGVLIDGLGAKQRILWILEPGDSIIMHENDQRLSFSGHNFEKLSLQYALKDLEKKIKKPSNPSKYITYSLDDYWDWIRYLDKKLELSVNLINSYKEKLSSFAFDYIKTLAINNIEEDRLDKFTSLRSTAYKAGISNQILCDIFDSCFYGESAIWARSKSDFAPGWYAFVRAEVNRKYGFDSKADSLSSDIRRRFLYYEHGKKIYKGQALERFLVDLLTDHTVRELGVNAETEPLLMRYYSESHVDSYKEYVQSYVEKARVLKSGMKPPPFSLTDIYGRQFSSDRLVGKIVVVDFWFTGCIGCTKMVPVMSRLEEEFRSDSNVVFLSISTDKDRTIWLNSINQKIYTSSNATHLFTGGQGENHPIIKGYNISSYPSIFLLDASGKIVENPLPDPRHDKGEYLKELIYKKLSYLKDGPYVLGNRDLATVFTINSSVIHTTKGRYKDLSPFVVHTDQFDKTFSVSLKKVLRNEPAKFKEPEKILALSDIEGNFYAFRKLLQSGKVIDENYNWIFGKGHLVICGDVFDRGEQVTECLWLIYSLEEKAKAAGGYVHFILGNHEIMNLSGDLRYNKEKYKWNLRKIGLNGSALYDHYSELGRWLRTKNIIEVIGDMLFVHAGISDDIKNLNLPLKQLNNLVRPFYDKDTTARRSKDRSLSLLYDTKQSPFWYRLYYLDQEMKVYTNGDTLYKPADRQINAALEKFKVSHIITGHTIVADTVSMHYGGKVINLDTPHAKGKSEALLIENRKFFRVDAERTIIPLYAFPK